MLLMNKKNISETITGELTLRQFAHKHRGKTIVCYAMGKEFYGKIWGYGIHNEAFPLDFILVKVPNHIVGFVSPSCQDPVFVLPKKSTYRYFWITYDEQTKFKIMKKMV